MRSRHKHAGLLLVAILGTAALTRVRLWLIPDGAGLTVAGHHIHHLFVGVGLMAIGGIPAALTRTHSVWKKPSVVIFGVGIGLALDEMVLMIVRDTVPETAYSSSVSVVGAVSLVVLACIYVLVAVAMTDD
jgi:hypothetical protein